MIVVVVVVVVEEEVVVEMMMMMMDIHSRKAAFSRVGYLVDSMSAVSSR